MMARHRGMSERRWRAGTIAGGVLAGGVLFAAGPAGMAFADDLSPGEYTGNRPNFTNPAPVVRGVQQIGDSTFDPQPGDGPLVANARAQLNAGPLGQVYHEGFGTSGDPGTNGKVTGVLNTGFRGGGDQFNPPTTIPGRVYAQTVNIHECQMKWNTDTGGWNGISSSSGSSACNGSG